jgi:hypothetical protein
MNQRARRVGALSIPFVVLGLALAGCSGASAPTPTVTKTVDAPSSSEASTPPTPSASATPSKPVSITWVEVDHSGEPDHLESERLSIPTLENASDKVQKAFDAQVSKQVDQLRQAILPEQVEYNPEGTGSYLKSSKINSGVYQERYAGYVIALEGASGDATEKIPLSRSLTVDTTTGRAVPLQNFVDIPEARLRSMLLENLKQRGIDPSAYTDQYNVVDGEYSWMPGHDGIFFRFDYMYTDYTFTIPWSELGR